MARNKNIEPWILCAASLALLSAGWLMRSFPVLVFVGIAPLFAIVDLAAARVKRQSAWNYIELILLALIVMYWSASFFEGGRLVIGALQAIVIGLAFAAYTFSKISINDRLGKWLLILYWLAAEFLFLVLAPNQFTYLADSLALKSDWVRWSQHTGYLGVTAWILLCNLLLYVGLLKERRVQWIGIIFFVIALALPLWFSHQLADPGIVRSEMVSLYSTNSIDLPVPYRAQGEFVSRTASWISLLILVFSFVRNKVKQK